MLAVCCMRSILDGEPCDDCDQNFRCSSAETQDYLVRRLGSMDGIPYSNSGRWFIGLKRLCADLCRMSLESCKQP